MKNIQRNKPFDAFRPESKTLVKAGSVLQPEHDVYIYPAEEKRTLYDGRYCAVSGFLFAVVRGKYSVLANQRGPGAPDYKGYWNCPCGFLERGENSKDGIAREIMEECIFKIDPEKLKIVYVETEPEKCNNGNVTIRHYAFLGKQYPIHWDPTCGLDSGGEKDEVETVRWIPVESIGKYEWAFGHKETIEGLLPGWWKRKLLEFWYGWLKR